MMFDGDASSYDEADSGWARRPLMAVITSRDHASTRLVEITPGLQQMRAAYKH